VATLELYGTARCPHTAKCASGWSGNAASSSSTTWKPIPWRAPHARDRAWAAHRAHPGRGRQSSSSGVARTRLHRRRVGDADNNLDMASACSIRVRGVVQGVGFRPFVYRLACANTLNGWVLNAEEGVEIHLEGAETGLEAFVRDLKAQPPSAASITEIDVQPARAGRFARIQHPDEPAPTTPDRSDFARPAGL
jgi:acylphosphatase